jgi:hypothetical protein
LQDIAKGRRGPWNPTSQLNCDPRYNSNSPCLSCMTYVWWSLDPLSCLSFPPSIFRSSSPVPLRTVEIPPFFPQLIAVGQTDWLKKRKTEASW